MTFRIGNHTVGESGRCFIIGEVAQAHDGSLGAAHAFIDAIADAGADAVKFQTHIAEAESSPQEPWRVRFSPQDATRFDYWKRMEFRESEWQGLKTHADERKLVFLSSPFSAEAVELLERVGMPVWKIASGEVNNPVLLDQIGPLGKPVLLSSGMSDMSALDRAVERLRRYGCPVAVMQCSSTYPTPPEKVGLNLLGEFRDRYGCPVGLSDHSGRIYAGLAGAALGADILEVHVTMSRAMFGPDVPASITPEELAALIEGVRFIGRAIQRPVDKNHAASEMDALRHIFTKSLFAAADLEAGTILQPSHLVPRKPGTGIPVERIDEVIGRRLTKPVKKSAMLQRDDLEPSAG
jgi:N,N'-diacetyllegionaminate synthase